MNTITFILICGFFVLSNQHAIEDHKDSKQVISELPKLKLNISKNHKTNNAPPIVDRILDPRPIEDYEKIIIENYLKSNNKCSPDNEEDITTVLENILVGIYNLNIEIAGIKNSIANLESIVDVGNMGSKTLAGVHYNKKSLKKTDRTMRKSCKELYESGYNQTGVYKIQPKSSKTPIAVFCDMGAKGGGGWTVIQNRFDGSQDFYLEWRDYKFGFGDFEGEFWLGLENIHKLTGYESTELLVELEDKDGQQTYARYKKFAIGSEWDGYTLNTLSDYSGNAGDALMHQLGQKFSTKDFDRDAGPTNCAELWRGAWWHKDCFLSNLNAKYSNTVLPPTYELKGMHWTGTKPQKYAFTKSRMLVRPTG